MKEKLWHCQSNECNEVLGRIEYHGSVTVLMVNGVVAIGMVEVPCDCGFVSTWEPNAEALRYLIGQRKAERRERIDNMIKSIKEQDTSLITDTSTTN